MNEGRIFKMFYEILKISLKFVCQKFKNFENSENSSKKLRTFNYSTVEMSKLIQTFVDCQNNDISKKSWNKNLQVSSKFLRKKSPRH